MFGTHGFERQMNLPWFERFPRRVTQGVSRLRGIRDNSPSLSLGSFTHSRPDHTSLKLRVAGHEIQTVANAVFCLFSNNYAEFESCVFETWRFHVSFELLSFICSDVYETYAERPIVGMLVHIFLMIFESLVCWSPHFYRKSISNEQPHQQIFYTNNLCHCY